MTDLATARGAQLVARTRPIDPPRQLLDHLGGDGFAWLDGSAGFVTAGIAATVAPANAVGFLRALRHEHDCDAPGTAGPRAVGALPFDGTDMLVVPAVVIAQDADGRAWQTVVSDRYAAARGGGPPLHIATPRPARFTVETCMRFDEWRDAVTGALDLIAAGVLEKVVLARAVRVEADQAVEPRAVLRELQRTQPGCTVYGASGFVGASPELLVRKRGSDVVSRPLAGTGTDAARLVASPKDAREHEIVVDAVSERLAMHCGAVRAEGPVPLGLVDVTHLATTVSGRCHDARTSAVDLARALHPTPAVAGTPRAAALDVIRQLERHGRGRYAGPCGWVDRRGDGEFVVALRCGALNGASAVLHAGAGIVAGSDPDAEWLETQQKLEPILRALVRP
jgi:menaquinone-specific isochorismate synthase